jgi:energy-coupling factor transport system ATP-binding protein
MNDALIEVRGLSYSYSRGAGGEKRALDRIDLSIRRGEFVVLTGPSGCGKSTLCRCLVGLIPNTDDGAMTGEVIVAGMNTRDHSPGAIAGKIAMTFQNTDDQLFSNSVEAEIAFGPEHMGLKPAEIDARIAAALEAAGAGHLRDRPVDELSGGEKQRIAIASSLALMPEALLLDEPTSELDPAAAFDLIDMLRKINRAQGTTIVIVEHRLERLHGIASRLVVMDRGRIAIDCAPEEAYDIGLGRYGVFEPPAATFSRRFGGATGGKWVARTHDRPKSRGRCLISLKDVSFAYQKSATLALDGITLDLYGGELAVIMGANGSGKTTLVKHMNGLLRPDRGSIIVDGEDIAGRTTAWASRKVGVVFQNPDHQLFAETVYDELAFGPKNLGVPADTIKSQVDGAAQRLDIGSMLHGSPFTLSGGEKQRVAIASTLTLDPVILVLDEPTLGLNHGLKEKLAAILATLTAAGRAVVVVTHDMEFAAAHADRVSVMSNGRIIRDGDARQVLTDESLAAVASLHLPQAAVIGKSIGLDHILRIEEISREEIP